MEFIIATTRKEELIDITERVNGALKQENAGRGVCTVYVPHATCAVLINEYEPNLTKDFLASLDSLVSGRAYLHDTIDDNATAHLKSGLLGPSASIPIHGSQLALGTWQRVVLCEFDGPRERRVIVEAVAAR